MLHYKTANSLFESRLYSINIYINQYNQTAYIKEWSFANNKKSIIHKYIIVYDALLIHSLTETIQ